MRNMILQLLLLALVSSPELYAQSSKTYSTANAHSHNDYEQNEPFYLAYKAGFGSMEADVFLRNGELYVAHNAADIRQSRTLTTLYIEPISIAFRRNKEKVHLQVDKNFQLLIDLKTGGDSTLTVLTKLLARYPNLFDHDKNPNAVKVIISGERPTSEDWADFSAFIYFDGRPAEHYSATALKKVGLISDSFRSYSNWDGRGAISEADKTLLGQIVQKAHMQGKPFRFWAVPDSPAAWQLMCELGVDFINTDNIEELATWFKKNQNTKPSW